MFFALKRILFPRAHDNARATQACAAIPGWQAMVYNLRCDAFDAPGNPTDIVLSDGTHVRVDSSLLADQRWLLLTMRAPGNMGISLAIDVDTHAVRVMRHLRTNPDIGHEDMRERMLARLPLLVQAEKDMRLRHLRMCAASTPKARAPHAHIPTGAPHRPPAPTPAPHLVLVVDNTTPC